MNNKDARPNNAAELRRQAKEIARRKEAQTPEDLAALSPQKVGQMLYELRVHQIELEMQNEELRRIQEELESSRARYFDLYDLAPVGYVTVNEKGMILEANLTTSTLLGMDRGELVKKPLTRFILPEDQDVYYRHRRQLFEKGMPQICVLRILQSNADPFWAQIESTAAKDVDGASICRILISDISERRQIEEALQQSEDKFRLAFQANPDAIVISRLDDGLIVDVNQGFTDLTGFTREEVVGRTAMELNLWHKPDGRERLVKGLLEQGYYDNHEGQFRGKDGRLGFGLTSARVLMLGKVPHVLSITRDISESKRMEEALLSAHQEVSDLLESISDAFFALDNELVITYFNAAAERMLGKKAKEVLGYPLFDAFPEARGSVFEERYRAAIKEKKFCSFEVLFDIQPYRNWYDVRVFPQKNGISVFFQITTQRKEAEEEIRRLNAELEERVRERTAELVQSNKELTIEIAERLKMEQALKESKEQLRILASQILSAQEDERKRIALEIHDILGSSLSAIKFKMEDILNRIHNVPIDKVVEGMENLFPIIKGTIADVRRIQADLRPPLLDDLGIVATLSWFCKRFETIYSGIKVDQAVTIREEDVPDHLKIVLFRIIQEALNNIGKHAKADTVDLGLRKMDGTIELSIRDNGEGFDPISWSAEKNSEKGLGLSSMKERTKFSGGSFLVESAKGKGTVIQAVWPV